MVRIHAVILCSLLALFSPAFASPSGASALQSHLRGARHRQRVASKRSGWRSVVYTCPMHPDISSDSRGTCPKCAMDLVPKRRAAGTHR